MTHRLRPAVPLFAVCLLLTSSAAAQPLTDAQYEPARRRMVDEFVIGQGIKNKRVIQAMLDTPRHEFVPPNLRKEAYYDKGLPIGEAQTISSPFIVSYMTECLDPQPTDKVLEIGTGSGYQAAVLSPLVKEVYSIEVVDSLGRTAEKTLKRLGYKNVFTKIGDGFQGWAEHAPFDKLIVTCSPEKVPQPLVEQLREGGRIVIPVGDRYQQMLCLLFKKDGKVETEPLRPTLFVPMTGTAEAERRGKAPAANFQVVNGSFERPVGDGGGIPGWYYERLVTWEADDRVPDGQHCVTMRSQEAGRAAMLLQGIRADGREATSVEISVWVKCSNAQRGRSSAEQPAVSLSLFDDERRELTMIVLGPFLGTSVWHRATKTVRIPPQSREGILRLGLFGATGTISFDDVKIKAVGRAGRTP